MYVLYDEMVTRIHVPFCFIIFLSYHIYTQTLTISKINILSFFSSGSETLEPVPFIFFIEEYENFSQERANVLSHVIDE